MKIIILIALTIMVTSTTWSQDIFGLTRNNVDTSHFINSGSFDTNRVAFKDKANQFTQQQKFLKDIDTVNFAGSNFGGVTQNNTQTGKILITHATVRGLTDIGDFTVTNNLVTVNSIINVTFEYVSGDIITYAFVIGVTQIAAGSFHIWFTPSVSGTNFLDGDCKLHYRVDN